ncbi:hypothetical protein RAS_05720 [Rickettsia asiatica]|uniref:Uncharacterized protein n=1 Tax=Rickettsia asiatica TaxID=238800 RepID=A0A510G737_9RICK|nr:type II toxin-antitoxin system VapC family toxin [Rickettsia asiatica]BBJ31463.1 hypothetical protein RAS_05720 [Rickettsia asiatica]
MRVRSKEDGLFYFRFFSSFILAYACDEVANLGILDKTVKEGAIVPSIWRLEIGSVLLCAERAKHLTPNQCHQAIYTLKDIYIKIDQITLEHIWFETMDLAVQYGLTLYDARAI